jgi:hypothetical protein
MKDYLDLLNQPWSNCAIIVILYICTLIASATLTDIALMQPYRGVSEKGSIVFIGIIGIVLTTAMGGLLIYQFDLYSVPILAAMGFGHIVRVVYQVYKAKHIGYEKPVTLPYSR